MKWQDWNSITAATAEMHHKPKNTVCDNTTILALLNSVFDDHWDNINLAHECMTINAGWVDYGENNLFSLKYTINWTCHCLTVGLMFPVSVMPPHLSSNTTRYVCPAHQIRDFPRQAFIFRWPYRILEEVFWFRLVFLGVVVFLFFKANRFDYFNAHFSWIFSLYQWLQYY